MTGRELQLRLAYAVLVAGKSASFAEAKTQSLFGGSADLPFDMVRRWDEDGSLERRLREARTGNYAKTSEAFRDLASRVADGLDLSSCSPEELEETKGIGPKTSRFFILWTRPDARCAALDIHILRWLKELGHDVPDSTPQSRRKYASIEKVFLAEADKRNKTPRELDAEIWDRGSGYGGWDPDSPVGENQHDSA